MIELLVLLLRVALGLVFVVAGGLKIGHFDVFASQIAGFQILPRPFVAPLALLMPFIEVLVGGYLIVGLFTRATAGVAALLLAVFDGAIASAVVRGISTSCGCFGPSDQTTTSWAEVARDAALVAVALFIAWRAPGALALDRRIGNDYEQSGATSG
jgi:uncharacterized membrane protein YphA (DoxX/SURF4 family)